MTVLWKDVRLIDLGRGRLVKGILVLVAVAAALLVFSSAASASSLSCAHGSTCNSGNLGGPTTPTSGGTLPFTGYNLAGVAGVGALLLVSGLSLQRASRRRR